MTRIVGAGVSQFHNDENNFELLLAYADGREVGFVVSRKVAQNMAEELRREAGSLALPGGDEADMVAIDRTLLEAAISEIRKWKVEKGGDDQVVLNLEAILEAA